MYSSNLISYSITITYGVVAFGRMKGPSAQRPQVAPEATCYVSELPGARPLLLQGPSIKDKNTPFFSRGPWVSGANLPPTH